MKRLLEQNNVKVFSDHFLIFDCNNCGCKFESDEYHIKVDRVSIDKVLNTYEDGCFVCKKACIIKEEVNAED